MTGICEATGGAHYNCVISLRLCCGTAEEREKEKKKQTRGRTGGFFIHLENEGPKCHQELWCWQSRASSGQQERNRFSAIGLLLKKEEEEEVAKGSELSEVFFAKQ